MDNSLNTTIVVGIGDPQEVVAKQEKTSGAASSPTRVRAKYDIAQTSVLNEAHWANADNFDADRANSQSVRSLARNRSRLETDNNPSLKGIVRTVTHYEVGTGPTLHIDSDDETLEDEVEQRWSEWCEAINLPGKLRQMVYGRVVDGEAFARIGSNPSLNNAVKLDIQPFECDRCYTLWLPYMTPYRIDGVWFDTWGNPTYYDILQYHPGPKNSPGFGDECVLRNYDCRLKHWQRQDDCPEWPC